MHKSAGDGLDRKVAGRDGKHCVGGACRMADNQECAAARTSRITISFNAASTVRHGAAVPIGLSSYGVFLWRDWCGSEKIVRPPIPMNNRPSNRAMANRPPSLSITSPSTSARAIPTETTVAATSVESASAETGDQFGDAQRSAARCRVCGWPGVRTLQM